MEAYQKIEIPVPVCMRWLNEVSTNMELVELIFPVVGYLYIPSDRVFVRSEKEIKKKKRVIFDHNV